MKAINDVWAVFVYRIVAFEIILHLCSLRFVFCENKSELVVLLFYKNKVNDVYKKTAALVTRHKGSRFDVYGICNLNILTVSNPISSTVSMYQNMVFPFRQ